MSNSHAGAGGALVVVGGQGSGITVIPSPTQLTRLHYYDGKFLRAQDMDREQTYLRSLVHLSNQGGGWGVVHGLDTVRGSGDTLQVGPGMAIDGAGRVLLLPAEITVDVARLVAAATAATSTTAGGAAPKTGTAVTGEFADCDCPGETPTADTAHATDLYLVTVGWAEAYCGEEDVYGRLCEDACATSTDRPFLVEGLTVKAVPLTLASALAASNAVSISRKHLRSAVASAYFADERALRGRGMSKARLMTDVWCLGAQLEDRADVPLGVLARSGSSTVFFDAWTARRERIDTPARRYWQWQMDMRPWNVYLAQVLQFQCQLHEVLAKAPEAGADEDPCSGQTELLRQAARFLEEMEKHYAATGTGPNAAGTTYPPPEWVTKAGDLKTQVTAALEGAAADDRDRILLTGGIVELPPAGYLPVVPGSVDVDTQVRRLMGEGVDLRFCVARPDFIPHAFEEAQHLERISLLQGLDDPTNLPQVDVLVPDGEWMDRKAERTGTLFEVSVDLTPPDFNDVAAMLGGAAQSTAGAGGAYGYQQSTLPPPTDTDTGETDPTATVTLPRLRGAARGETLETGGGTFHMAALASDPPPHTLLGLMAWGMSRKGGSGQTGIEYEKGGVKGHQQMPPTQSTTVGTSVTGSGQDLPLAVWLSMRTDRSPFALTPGQAATVRVEGAAAVTIHGIPVGLQAALTADFYHISTLPAGGGTRVQGRATGTLSTTVVSPTATKSEHGISVSVMAKLDLTTDAAGRTTLAVETTSPDGIELTFTTSWSGDPTTALWQLSLDLFQAFERILLPKIAAFNPTAAALMEAKLEMNEAKLRSVQLATADLRENDDVYLPENPAHVRAVTALKRLEDALRQPGFRAFGEALLFPPPVEGAAQGCRVRATRDWVLFHRRRDRACCCPAPKAVAPAPRLYTVYQVAAPANATVGEIRESVAQGEAPKPDEMQVVGVVRFRGGTSVLDTPADQILSVWSGAGSSDVLLWGGIAAEGAARNDPKAVVADRLDRVVEVVKAETPRDPQSAFDVLGMVPAGFSATGTDGVIVLVTVRREVETVCQKVLRLLPNHSLDMISDAAKEGSLASVLGRAAVPVGTVYFAKGTATVVDDSTDGLLQDWQSVGGGGVAGALVVSGTADPAATEVEVRQGKVAVAAVNGTVTPSQVTASEGGFAGDCGAIVVLAPQAATQPATTCMQVWRMKSAETFEQAMKSMGTNELAASVAGGGGAPMGPIRFQSGTATPADGSYEAVVGAWEASGGGAAGRGIIVSAQSDGGAIDLLKAQAMELIGKIGGSIPGHAVYGGTLPAAPGTSACGSVLLLMGSQTTTDTPGSTTTATRVPAGMETAVGTGGRTAARIARVVPAFGQGSGRDPIATDAPLALKFAPDGKLAGGAIPDAVVAGLKEALTENQVKAYVQVGLAPLTGTADAAAATRRQAFFDALKAAGLLVPAATQSFTTANAAEKEEFGKDSSGNAADDVIFVQVNVGKE